MKEGRLSRRSKWKERGREGGNKEGPTIFFSLNLYVGYKLPNINPLSFITQFSFFTFLNQQFWVSVYNAAQIG